VSMKTPYILLGAMLFVGLIDQARAGCTQKRSRDPSFVELAVPDDAIRPASAQDFAFVTDETTYDQLVAKVGPPDAAHGTRVSYYIWCFADDTELTVATKDRLVIDYIRHDGKMIYKRGKKK